MYTCDVCKADSVVKRPPLGISDCRGTMSPIQRQQSVRRGAIRWSKGGVNFRADREVKTHLVTQFTMRVQAPPSKCRSESVSPRPVTGSQGLEAGINGGAWKPNPGIPSSRYLWAATAKMWMSHRQRKPAQEADALEPKGHRIRRRQPPSLTGLHRQ